MTQTARTDVHRPAEFDPADYCVIDYLDNKPPQVDLSHLFELGGIGARAAAEVIAHARAEYERRIFAHFPDWRTGGDDHQSIFQCNHCGNPHIRWVAVVEHIPTGKRLAFGEQCADRVELSGRDAFRARYVKTHAEKEAARLENEAKRAAFRAEHPDVAEYLTTYDEETAAHDGSGRGRRRSSEFLDSLSAQFGRKGELSEKQIEAVRKNITREAEFAASKATESATAGPFPTGRQTVEGEIVSTKVQDSDFGSTLKMLVKTDDGNKLWGTCPESVQKAVGDWYLSKPSFPGPDARVRWSDDYGYMIEGESDLRGKRVRFTATFERSHDDEHFGFFKRPSKAELLKEEN